MQAKEFDGIMELAESLRDRGIELACCVENGVMRITAGRARQEKTAFSDFPSVGYL
jgi:beta-phosphoglucomutase-like phosphatase (HAD superfamily)